MAGGGCPGPSSQRPSLPVGAAAASPVRGSHSVTVHGPVAAGTVTRPRRRAAGRASAARAAPWQPEAQCPPAGPPPRRPDDASGRGGGLSTVPAVAGPGLSLAAVTVARHRRATGTVTVTVIARSAAGGGPRAGGWAARSRVTVRRPSRG